MIVITFIIDFNKSISYLAFLFLVPLCMIILLSFRQSSVSKTFIEIKLLFSSNLSMSLLQVGNFTHHPSSKYNRLVYYGGTFPLGDVC